MTDLLSDTVNNTAYADDVTRIERLRLAEKDHIVSFTRAEAQNNEELNRQYDDFLSLRTEFIRENGWLDLKPGQDDTDEYDQNPETRYVLLEREGKVITGLRLTPVQKVEEALSYKMWKTSIDRGDEPIISGIKENKTALEGLGKSGAVWDLTRLVSRYSLLEFEPKTREERIDRYNTPLKLFGAGYATTGSGSTWIFTSSDEVSKYLDAVYMTRETLWRGKISAVDKENCSFCVMDTDRAYRSHEENSLRLKFFNLGYRAIAGSETNA